MPLILRVLDPRFLSQMAVRDAIDEPVRVLKKTLFMTCLHRVFASPSGLHSNMASHDMATAMAVAALSAAFATPSWLES